jgi:hypothetical protein
MDRSLLRFEGAGDARRMRHLRRADEDEEQPKGVLPRRRLLCASCRHPVTDTAKCIVVQGAHEHVRTNPHGYTFRFGCFSVAPGCTPAGIPTPEWSWFPGYHWRLAVCGRCSAHLGWAFRGAEASEFFALVLNRLVPAEEGDS